MSETPGSELLSRAYKEGVQACASGNPIRSCPYKGTKGEVIFRVEWCQGYADQAKNELKEELEDDSK